MKVRGFTLIELLVVVSIIGILATVVLASLGSARTNAQDAKVKALMSQMRNQAEIFFLEHGSYRGTDTNGMSDDDYNACLFSAGGYSDGSLFDPSLDGNIALLGQEVYDITDSLSARVFCAYSSTAVQDSWAFAAPLHNPESGTTGWCVDSSGNTKAVNLNFSSTGAPLGGGGALSMCP